MRYGRETSSLPFDAQLLHLLSQRIAGDAEHPGGEEFRSSVNRLHAAREQLTAVNDYFERLAA